IADLILALAFSIACTNRKVNNPLAIVRSKQPDKDMFDRGMDAMKHNRFDVARMTMQTLINTYPDSEFIARAKLAVADSWYAEGGTTSLAQAEVEYKDFETFFPNMPEAAEAQLKIANIHYQEMEKPDRDYTHAMRAEEEYRQLILQWPDSKLVPEAKQRLMQVQEVIAEREFRVGRFYYGRQSYPAAIARLRSLADKYPLYSKADEALYLLGQAYEGEITQVRSRPMNEAAKARMIQQFTAGAAESYSRIITRYPLMDRTDDAKTRLTALHQPVPKPTKAAVAQNRAEENSRKEATPMTRVMSAFQKHPNTAPASRVGEPTLIDPRATTASEVIRSATNAAMGTSTHSTSVETINGVGAPPADQPAPRSDTPAAEIPVVSTTDNSAATPSAGAGSSPITPTNAAPDPNELKPDSAAAPDPNELKPNVSSSQPDSGQNPPAAPAQVNEIQNGSNGASGQAGTDGSSSSSADQTADAQDLSSSKHKKKKGLGKLNPF
ncbi:MAG: uptake lipoprotein-like protein, partial [Acidobacteriaceae bacterium]|nr:uptake lipoprotein-like protein [Acidobacteriaceae bacterium]